MISHFHFSQNLDFHPFSIHKISNVCARECFNLDHKLLRLDYFQNLGLCWEGSSVSKVLALQAQWQKFLPQKPHSKSRAGILHLWSQHWRGRNKWVLGTLWSTVLTQLTSFRPMRGLARGRERDKYRWMVLL